MRSKLFNDLAHIALKMRQNSQKALKNIPAEAYKKCVERIKKLSIGLF